MDIPDIQSIVTEYLPIDDKVNTLFAIGSKDSFFNDIISYQIPLSDVHRILYVEKQRREKLHPYIGSREYKLVSLLRKHITSYWEIRVKDVPHVLIDDTGITDEMLSPFEEEGFKFVNDEHQVCIHIIEGDNPSAFYNRFIEIDLLLPVTIDSTKRVNSTCYTSYCKY